MEKDSVFLYLIIDGDLWQLTRSGLIQRLLHADFLDPNVETLQANQFTLNIGDDGLVVLSIFEGPSIVLQPINPLSIESWLNEKFDANTDVIKVVNDSAEAYNDIELQRLSTTETVDVGYQSRRSDSSNIIPKEMSFDDSIFLKPIIEVRFEHPDNTPYFNAEEVGSRRVAISGAVSNVDNAQFVRLVIGDSDPSTADIFLEVEIERQLFRIDQIDISALSDGQIQVAATVMDRSGQTLTAIDNSIKDTLFDISVDFLSAVYNANAVNLEQVNVAIEMNDIRFIQDAPAIVYYKLTDSLGLSVSGEWRVSSSPQSLTIPKVLFSQLAEGDVLLEVVSRDEAGNLDSSMSSTCKDTTAALGVAVRGDNQLDVNEVQAVIIDFDVSAIINGVPDVQSIENGQIVSVIIEGVGTDGLSQNQYQFDLTVTGQQFSSSLLNLPALGFGDGPLELNARVNDVAGNTVSARIVGNTDQVAEIHLQFDGDLVYSLSDTTQDSVAPNDGTQEVRQVTLSGNVFSLASPSQQTVEDGQLVEVMIDGSDINGAHLQIQQQGIIQSGQFVIGPLDLLALGFGDGPLAASVKTVDIAGNVATANATPADIDIIASASLSFDDQVYGNTDNAQYDLVSPGDSTPEFQQITVSGAVLDIESGQPVEINISGYNQLGQVTSISKNTVVTANGIFSVGLLLDVNQFANGLLTATATVADVEQNIAVTSTLQPAQLDTQANFDVQFDSGTDNTLNLDELTEVVISGLVVDQNFFDGVDSTRASIEDTLGQPGRQVNITIVNQSATESVSLTTDIDQGQFLITANLSQIFTSDEVLTLTAEVADLAGNLAVSQVDVLVDTQAGITVEFESNVYNKVDIDGGQVRVEVSLINIAVDALNPITVDYVLRDSLGNVQPVKSAIVTADVQTLTLDQALIQNLAEGEIFIDVTVSDAAGNSASDSNHVITQKDTVANLAVSIVSDDGNLSADEANNATLELDVSGLINGINGQTIDDGSLLTIKLQGFDSNANAQSVTLPDVVVSGLVTSVPVNLQDPLENGSVILADGSLTVIVSATDLAGNIAQAQTQTLLDVSAELNLRFDGDGVYSTSDEIPFDSLSPNDNTAEAQQVTLSGDVFDINGEQTVEDGQQVVIVINNFDDDGTTPINDSTGQQISATVSTTISNGEFSTALTPLELLSLGFQDGVIKAEARTQDLASNEVVANTNADVEDRADITLSFAGDKRYSTATDSPFDSIDTTNTVPEYQEAFISGQTVDVQEGALVDITLTGFSATRTLVNANLTATVQSDGSYQTAPIYSVFAFENGTLTATARVFDDQGNLAVSIQDDATIDTSASLTAEISGQGPDGRFNQAELAMFTVSGEALPQAFDNTTMTSIESNQNVELSFIRKSDGVEVASASTQLIASTTPSGNSTYTVTVDLSGHDSLGDPLLPNDDVLQVVVTARDEAGNIATASPEVNIDVEAELFLNFDGDKMYSGTLGSNEVSMVTLSGTSTGLDFNPSDQFTIIISSVDNPTITFPVLATILDDGRSFLTAPIDLVNPAGNGSVVFEDGTIQAFTSGVDSAGNPYDSVDFALIDTEASIQVQFNQNITGDGVYNQNEITQASIIGSVRNIEPTNSAPSNLVTLSFSSNTQITPQVLTGISIEPDGSFATVVDLQALGFTAKESVTVEATTQDLAGNISVNTDTVDVDLDAVISLQFDNIGGDTHYSETEAAAVTLSGNVLDSTGSVTVEANNIVTIILTGIDRYTGQFVSYEVSATLDTMGQFQSPIIDLLNPSGAPDPANSGAVSFADGTVKASAGVFDNAGNEATTVSDAEAEIDTLIFIDFNDQVSNEPSQDGSQLEGLRQLQTVNFKGTTDAEVGQSVTLTLTDGATPAAVKIFTAAVVAGSVSDVNEWVINDVQADNSFDTTIEWLVTVEVADQAGNVSADDLPTIILPTDAILDENNILAHSSNTFTGVADGSSDILSQGATHTFSAVQPFLVTLTSGGQLISATITDFNIVAVRDDGEKVFEANLAGDVVTMALSAPIDQESLGSNNFLRIDSLQIDSDGTTETLISPIRIDIIDGIAQAIDDLAQVNELLSISGNLLDNDIYVDQPSQVNAITFAGVTFLPGDSPVSINNGTDNYGALTFSSDGSWLFLASSNLDNQMTQVVSIDYEIQDSDGSTANAQLVITINDGIEGQVLPTTQSFVEPNITQVISPVVDAVFAIKAGSDGIDTSTVRFVSDSDINNRININSDGNPLNFEFIHTQQVQAFYIDSDSNRVNVLQFDLSASAISVPETINGVAVDVGDAQGVMVVSQFQSIDHILSDTINVFLRVVANDHDNTLTSVANIDWNITDGINLSIANAQSISVDETNLGLAPISAQGTVDLSVGSDAIKSVEFITLNQPYVTSGGLAVQYKLDGDDNHILIGYVVDSGEQEVFRATITTPFLSPSNQDITLDYEFILSRGLDQLLGQPTFLPLRLQAVDFDGDITQLPLDITIADGADPIINNVTLVVEEFPESNSADTIGQIDSAPLVITAGIDPVVDVAFDLVQGQAVEDLNGNAVTQDGKPLTWSLSVYRQASVVNQSGDIVLTLALPNDPILVPAGGTSTPLILNVNLFQSLDQLHGNMLDLLGVNILAVDSDGSTGEGGAMVTVVDGLPVEIDSTTPILAIDENDIFISGLAQDNSQALSFIAGSDSVKLITPDKTTFDAQMLTSQGNLVVLSSQRVGNFWLAHAVDNSGSILYEVFRIKFNDDGAIDLRFSQAIDHEAPLPDTADQNIQTIIFDVTVTDADNDISVPQSIVVNITDDVPEASPSEPLAILTEGESITTNIFVPPDLSVEGIAKGADDTSVIEFTVITKGINDTDLITSTYSVPLDGSFITVDLFDRNNLSSGSLSVNQQGDLQVDTQAVLSAEVLNYEIDFSVTDGDGDTITQTTRLQVLDSTGSVELTETTTDEDQPLVLDLIISVGDFDNSEAVSAIEIKADRLDGARLFLNDVELTEATPGSNQIILLSNQITDLGNGMFAPDGILTLVPAEHSSDFDRNIRLEAGGIISVTGSPFTSVVEVQAFITDFLQGDSSSGRFVKDVFTISVNAVADSPEWDTSVASFNGSEYQFMITEDYQGQTGVSSTTLDLVALFGDDVDPSNTLYANTLDRDDTDGSESLTYLLANVPAGIIIEQDGQVITASDTLTSLVNITIRPEINVSGEFRFQIITTSTESDNGSFAHQTSQDIVFSITPDADVPILNTRNVTVQEDQLIDVREFTGGSLSDSSGSEILYFVLALPDTNWHLMSSGTIVTVASNTYQISAADVISGQVFIQPPEDLSSLDSSAHFDITVQARAIETANGDIADSPESIAQIRIIGVADAPEIIDAGLDSINWIYDSTTQLLTTDNSVSVLEDQLLRLDFLLQTEDNQNTEVNSVLIRDLPEGFTLVDSLGNAVIYPVAGLDAGVPIINIPINQLNDTYIRLVEDFSGDLTFQLTQISTEPDGSSLESNIDVLVPITPVVDTSSADLEPITAFEDNGSTVVGLVVLDLLPELQDQDGSESLIGLTLTSATNGNVFIDGVVIVTPINLVDFLGGDPALLEPFLQSDRLQFQPAEDASSQDANPLSMSVQVDFTILDQSPTGLIVQDTFSSSIDIRLAPVVESDTRLAVAPGKGSFDIDGSVTNELDLSSSVYFIDADLDGSERLDYAYLIMPDSLNWYVTSTNGRSVVHNGQGTWLIDTAGLSNDSVQESVGATLTYITDGIVIKSNADTLGFENITIGARVLDGPDNGFDGDGELIETDIAVKFSNITPVNDAEDPIDIFSGNIVTAIEDAGVINIGGQLSGTDNTNGDVATDEDDVIFYRILVADLPSGAKSAIFTSTGMVVEYAANGETVVAFIFPESGLSDLAVSNLNQHFAGTLEIPIVADANDPSGDTAQNIQWLSIEIAPIADGIKDNPNGTLIFEEDIPRDVFGFGAFVDSNLTSQGVERFDTSQTYPVIFTVPLGASVIGAATDVVEITPTEYGVTAAGVFNLQNIFLSPPENFPTPSSDSLLLNVEYYFIDEAETFSGVTASDTLNDTISFNFTVNPVTDGATLPIELSSGDEDTEILLDGISVVLKDVDGSEISDAKITGVPEGALIKQGSEFARNLGEDGGSIDGKPTYAWGVDIASGAITVEPLYLVPSLDFSGRINLNVEVISEDKQNGDFFIVTKVAEVLVRPIADGLQTFGSIETDYQAIEGDAITVVVDTETLEVENPDEVIQIIVKADLGSDISALVGLDRIEAAGQTANFVIDNVTNTIEARLVVEQQALSEFNIFTGDLAFGQLQLELELRSIDRVDTGLLSLSDTSDPISSTLNIDIEAQVDAPTVMSSFEAISSVDNKEIPLDITLALQNPALNESGNITISGLPSNLSFNLGSAVGADWLVDQIDISNLAIVAPDINSDQSFALTITPTADLDGMLATGSSIQLQVDIADGDDNNFQDTLTATSDNTYFDGGQGSDTFTLNSGVDRVFFAANDQGALGDTADDVIYNFDTSQDQIDVTDMLASIALSDTELVEINAGLSSQLILRDSGYVVETITLDSVTFDQIYGDSSYIDANDVLQKMINDNILIVN